MHSGAYTVKDRTDMSGLPNAVQTAVDVSYPDGKHPLMEQVTEDWLQELAGLSADDPLPEWAETIQVPSSDLSAGQQSQTIQSNILALTGRQLRDQENGLNITTVLDGITSEKPFYDDVRPALRAIIWGFCREGRFVPVDDGGNALANEAVLNKQQHAQTRLKLLPSDSPDQCLKEGGFKETTESVADGIIHLREANQQLQSSIDGLREDVQLVAETDIHSKPINTLLDSLTEELIEASGAVTERLDSIRAQEAICDVVEETNAAQEWFDEEVTDVWNRRLETLYRFDAELTVGTSQYTWLDDEIQQLINEQQTALETFSGEWWTTDGWQTLMTATTTEISDSIQQSWNEHIEESGLSSLVDRIDSHPWVVPAMDLPPSVQQGFARQYITPLRELQRWYDTMDEALTSLTDDDEDTLAATTDSLADLNSRSKSMDDTTEELTTKLDRLTAAVGDRDLDEVDQIGIVPDDRDNIDKRLERLVEERELAVEDVDSGVIIR
jgi:hypothetical protein